MGLKNVIKNQNDNFRKRVEFIKDSFLIHGDYLDEGRYSVVFLPRMIIYKKSINTINFIHKIKSNANIAKSSNKQTIKINLKAQILSVILFIYTIPIRFMLSRYRHKKNTQKNYSCSLYFAQAQGGGVKLITFSKKRTLTILKSKTDFETFKEVYFTVPKNINTPIIDILPDENLVIEELVDNIKIENIHTKLLSKAINQYQHDLIGFFDNFNQNDFDLKNIKTSLDYFKKNIFDSKVIAIMDNLDLDTFIQNVDYLPFIDYKSDNKLDHFLITTSEYYLIDFENTQKISIFNLILVIIKDAFFRFDFDSLMKRFKSGYYDDLIDKFYSSLDFKYLREYKDEYMFISLLEFHHAGIDFYLEKNNLDKMNISAINDYIVSFMKRYFEL